MRYHDIKGSVVAALRELYPGEKIYGTDTVKGHERPCLSVSMTAHLIEGNLNVKRKGCYIEIIRMLERPDEAGALEFYKKIEDRFYPGFYAAGRFLHTQDLDADFVGDEGDTPRIEFYTEYHEDVERPERQEKILEEVRLEGGCGNGTTIRKY